ncbi:MAG: hypothetical protein EXR27_05435 [Betaproteobacteria bacterium]|nr:hypothetical protein [Betaproteobacteria bacterium]
MSGPAAAAGSPNKDLATQIFVELIGRAFLRVDNVAVIKPDPTDLARLSFKLAADFAVIEAEAKADAGPKNIGYDVSKLDLSSL